MPQCAAGVGKPPTIAVKEIKSESAYQLIIYYFMKELIDDPFYLAPEPNSNYFD